MTVVTNAVQINSLGVVALKKANRARSFNFPTYIANFRQNSNRVEQTAANFCSPYSCSKFWLSLEISHKWGFLTPSFAFLWRQS